jgi:DNA-binding NarL/FixJ family response regulator
VKPFHDPEAFLRYAQANHPRMAVIDVWMPVMNGLEVQRALNTVSPATRVIIFTGKDDPSVRSKALEAGASAFFLKPVKDEEFLACVKSVFSAG